MADITNGTAGSRRDYVMGNLRAVQVTSNVSTGNTWAPGLRIIESAYLTPTGSQSTITASADFTTVPGQVTFTITNGPATAALLEAFGY